MNTMSPVLRSCVTALLSAIAAAWALPGPAGAQEVDFSGRRINVIIGATPGGGTDGTTRLVGRFMERHLPGKPRMVYRNMPAGNGVQATNYFANEAKRDGSYWMGGGNAYLDAETMRQDVVHYDPRKFHFIGGVARGGSFISLRRSKLPNLSDKSMPPVVIGTGDGRDTWAEMMCWGAEVLGWNIRFVVGYPGTPSLMLAARRGEIDAFGTSNLGMLESLRKSGQYAELVQIGQTVDGKVVPRGSSPDVPTIAALLDGKLSGVALASFGYWSDSNQIDKWYALPPETPAAVVAAYRKAYVDVAHDPEFIKYGKAQFSPDFRYQTAEDMTRLVANTSYPNPEVLEFSAQLKVKYGLPSKPLTSQELAKLAAKLVGSTKVTSALLKVERGGRILHFKAGSDTHKARISGSRTKVSVAGKESKRSMLKPGMKCDIEYPGDGQEASKVACE